MEAKPTPGPWKFTHNHKYNQFEIETVSDKDGEYAHLTNNMPMGGLPEERAKCGCSRVMLANAQLFAASLDLFGALKELVAEHEQRSIDWESDHPGTLGLPESAGLVWAKEAIAKAEGSE